MIGQRLADVSTWTHEPCRKRLRFVADGLACPSCGEYAAGIPVELVRAFPGSVVAP